MHCRCYVRLHFIRQFYRQCDITSVQNSDKRTSLREFVCKVAVRVYQLSRAGPVSEPEPSFDGPSQPASFGASTFAIYATVMGSSQHPCSGQQKPAFRRRAGWNDNPARVETLVTVGGHSHAAAAACVPCRLGVMPSRAITGARAGIVACPPGLSCSRKGVVLYRPGRV